MPGRLKTLFPMRKPRVHPHAQPPPSSGGIAHPSVQCAIGELHSCTVSVVELHIPVCNCARLACHRCSKCSRSATVTSGTLPWDAVHVVHMTCGEDVGYSHHSRHGVKMGTACAACTILNKTHLAPLSIQTTHLDMPTICHKFN